MSDNDSGQPAAGAAPAMQPTGAPGGAQRFSIHSQYVKDLSFENPNAPAIYQELKSNPELKFAVDVGARRFQERLFEVIIKLNVESKIGDKQVFLVDMEYGVIAVVSEETPEEEFEEILMIDVPQLAFPFVRSIIADLTRDGSFPPLLVNQVDFADLLRRKKERAASQQDQQASAGGAGEESSEG